MKYEKLTEYLNELNANYQLSYDVYSILFDMAFELQEENKKYKDKIEQGKLIELPCKVGDKLYKITTVFGKKVVQPLYVYGFHCDGRKLWVVDCTSENDKMQYGFMIDEIGSEYFLTKAEAEAKLRELQNESI